MLLLTSTSDIIQLVTDSTATVDVHASWVDRASGVDTPGSTNTAIASAATTTVVAAPASSTTRNVRRLIIRNRHASTSVTVTTQLYNGTAFELDKRVLGPGSSMIFDDDRGFYPVPTGGVQTRPWFGVLAGCYGSGDPGDLMMHVQRSGWIGPTPTNIGTTVARCSAFMLPADLTFNRIRTFGIGATTSLYSVAIYRMSDLARLTSALTFTTAAATWVSIGSALNITLSKDTLYFVACAVVNTGATAGVIAMGTTTTTTTGNIGIAPASLPGSMAQGATNYLNHYQFQFTVASGVLPNPAATLAAAGAWTGGMPAFWLDTSDT